MFLGKEEREREGESRHRKTAGNIHRGSPIGKPYDECMFLMSETITICVNIRSESSENEQTSHVIVEGNVGFVTVRTISSDFYL